MSNKKKYGTDYKRIKIRTKNYGNKVLLTNDYGKWCVLTRKEYKSYLFKELSDALFNKLEKNFMILTDENLNKISHQFNDYYWFLNQGTSLHIIVPTLRCNLTCKYCYAFRAPMTQKDKDMTPKIADKTIDFIFKSPSKTYSIEFTGGEPLLRYDLVKRCILRAEKLAKEKKKKITFSLVTNGLFLRKSMFKFLGKYKVGLCISLDGPQKLHDANRRFTAGCKPTFNKVMEKINLFNNKKSPSINLLPVIVKESLKDWKEIVDTYIKIGANSLRFKYISRFGFASNSWKQMSYEPEEFLETWKKVINYMIKLNKKGIAITENIASVILFKLVQGLDAGYAELQAPCGAVIGQVVYDYDGSIYTCDEGRTMKEFKIGDVFSSKYKDLLNCPVTKALQSMSNLTATCDDCSFFTFCGICPLEMYNEKKGLITNIPANFRCKVHKGMFEFLFDKIINDKEVKDILFKWPFIMKGLGFGTYKDEKISRMVNPFKDYSKVSQRKRNAKNI